MNTITTLYIVRHGQSEASLKGIYGTDALLTEKGWDQANTASKTFEKTRLDGVFASNLKRAQETAKIIAQKHNLKVEIIDDLREPYYGEMEGKNRKKIKEDLKEIFEKREGLSDEERLRFKIVRNMESDEEALQRFLSAIWRIINTHAGKTLLAVSHVPVMKLLLIHLNYATRKELEGESIENGGYIKLEANGSSLIVKETKGVKK